MGCSGGEERRSKIYAELAESAEFAEKRTERS
jgi:hypothetical protein